MCEHECANLKESLNLSFLVNKQKRVGKNSNYTIKLCSMFLCWIVQKFKKISLHDKISFSTTKYETCENLTWKSPGEFEGSFLCSAQFFSSKIHTACYNCVYKYIQSEWTKRTRAQHTRSHVAEQERELDLVEFHGRVPFSFSIVYYIYYHY